MVHRIPTDHCVDACNMQGWTSEPFVLGCDKSVKCNESAAQGRDDAACTPILAP